MDLFKTLYCYQYYRLNKEGKEGNAQIMGNILSAIAFLLIVLSVYFLFVALFPDFEKDMMQELTKLFGRSSGKLFGKKILFVVFIAAYPLMKYIYGTDEAYKKTILEFNTYSEIEKSKLAKKGSRVLLFLTIL